ncbi:SLBB domain-containing protein [Pseudomonadales bacterium]|nr:SLBB domain-containing protein [Pseudomonadales bacterium]
MHANTLSKAYCTLLNERLASLVCFLVFVMIVSLIFSPLAMANTIPSALIDRVKDMSPEQQLALAEQYGFAIPTLGASPTGTPGARNGFQPPLQRNKSINLSDLLDEEKPKPKLNEEAPLTRFGNKFFSPSRMAYKPVDSNQVPSGYILGPGDELIVQIIGKDSKNSQLTVDREGKIVVPSIGSIHLSGISLQDAKDKISQTIQKKLLGNKVVVSLGPLRQISILLAGEVNVPGSYNVSALTRISQALYLSGGISDIGTYREIRVSRQGEVVAELDLYQLLIDGDRRGDVWLQNGDVVFVPVSSGMVSVQGEVRREGLYDIVSGETFEEIVRYAGGFKPTAYINQATIQRLDPLAGRSVILSVSQEDKGREVRSGDKITIPKASPALFGKITLEGAVVRPGTYQYQEGLRISDFIADPDGDLTPKADLNVGLILRRKNERLETEVLAFDVADALKARGSLSDLKLMPNDKILILPQVEAKPGPKTALIEVDQKAKLKPKDEEKQDEEKGAVASNRFETEILGNFTTVPFGPRFAGEEAEPKDLSQFDHLEKRWQKTGKMLSRRQLLAPVITEMKVRANLGDAASVVTIVGAVQQQGKYPLISNRNGLKSLIKLAGGAKDGAYLQKIEIRRIKLDQRNGNFSTRIIEVDLNTTAELPALQAMDVVRVHYFPNWNPDAVVSLKGEVKFPGLYAIRQNETLGSIIRRAGGLLDTAFPEAIKYTSVATKELQFDSARKLIERFKREQLSRQSVGLQSGRDQGAQLEDDITEAINQSFQGRLVVDVPRILSGDNSADVLLQDGDKIVVPKMARAVTVTGEVYEPGSFLFSGRANLDSYIDLAAGFTERARKKDVYVIRPNGGVVKLRSKRSKFFRFSQNELEIPAGSVIVVPTNYDYEQPLTKYRAITSVVFESVASIAAFFSITRK